MLQKGMKRLVVCACTHVCVHEYGVNIIYMYTCTGCCWSEEIWGQRFQRTWSSQCRTSFEWICVRGSEWHYWSCKLTVALCVVVLCTLTHTDTHTCVRTHTYVYCHNTLTATSSCHSANGGLLLQWSPLIMGATDRATRRCQWQTWPMDWHSKGMVSHCMYAYIYYTLQYALCCNTSQSSIATNHNIKNKALLHVQRWWSL